jgi:hypothetical protein
MVECWLAKSPVYVKDGSIERYVRALRKGEDHGVVFFINSTA